MKIMLANFAKMANATGGLAKVTVAFANEMVRRGHDVSLVYCDECDDEFFYPINNAVKIVNLCHYEGREAHFPLWMKLKREILRPISIRSSRDVNDQFMEQFLTEPLDLVMKEIEPEIIVASQPAATRMLLDSIGTDLPIITMSHGDPEDYFHTYPLGEVDALGKCIACQVLVPSFAGAIKQRFPEMRMEVIGNVVPQYESKAELEVNKTNYKILFIGRLTKNHKRPHLLVEAFIKIAADFPAWSVEIWGAVDKKIYLEQMKAAIKKAGLENRIVFKGVTSDVEAVLKQGDIFVFPSAYEGFGLSLAEAMSMGIPVVGYRECPAVNELIVDGKNGILCESGTNALSEALRALMGDRELRVRLGNEARNSMKCYDADAIWTRWEKLLTDINNEAHKCK